MAPNNSAGLKRPQRIGFSGLKMPKFRPEFGSKIVKITATDTRNFVNFEWISAGLFSPMQYPGRATLFSQQSWISSGRLRLKNIPKKRANKVAPRWPKNMGHQEWFWTASQMVCSFPRVRKVGWGDMSVVVSLQQLTLWWQMVYRLNISCKTPCSATHNIVGSNTTHKI